VLKDFFRKKLDNYKVLWVNRKSKNLTLLA
jgi:hypothetical protein